MTRLAPWLAILGPLAGIAALLAVAWLDQPEPPRPPAQRSGVGPVRPGRDVPFDWARERAA